MTAWNDGVPIPLRAMLPTPAVPIFRDDAEDSLRHFVSQGFAIYRDVFAPELIARCRDFLGRQFNTLNSLAVPHDINGWSVAIMNKFERSELYAELLASPKLIHLAKTYVGPDVIWFSHDGLFINVPSDKDPVLLKGRHTDVWTGTGVDTVFAALFFTDCDQYNGLSVCPGSHAQGLMPVYNRKVAPGPADTFSEINLDMVKAGDLVVWHALTIHSTTGHSDKNIRISMTSRFASAHAQLTSQERMLGYRPLCAGPLAQVRRLVGNDFMTPFRTHGGFVGVDRRMADVYDLCPSANGETFDRYLRD